MFGCNMSIFCVSNYQFELEVIKECSFCLSLKTFTPVLYIKLSVRIKLSEHKYFT